VGQGSEGFVLTERFIGDAKLLNVIFAGLEKPVVVRMPAGASPGQGTSLAFAIDSAEVLVFTADGSTPI
jgi:hypothetical protein